MMQVSAIQTISMLREEIVAVSGSGGPEVSEVNAVLVSLEKGDIDPKEAVFKANQIKARTKAISH